MLAFKRTGDPYLGGNVNISHKFLVFFFFFFETISHLAQIGLDFLILLPLFSQSWGYKYYIESYVNFVNEKLVQ